MNEFHRPPVSYAYLGDHVGLIVTATGKRMYVDTLDTTLAPHLILDGYWEQWLSTFIRSTLAPGSVFLDVGANVGWYTLLALEQGAYVHAFEPNPRIHALLSRTLTLNNFLPGTVKTHQLALLDLSGTLTFVCPKHWGGNGRVRLDAPQAEMRGTDQLDEFPVVTRSLDSLQLGAVDYIKIDAEGAESLILRGAERTLRENLGVRLLVEHHALEAEYETITWLREELDFQLSYVDHQSRLKRLTVADLPSLPDSEMLYLVRA